MIASPNLKTTIEKLSFIAPMLIAIFGCYLFDWKPFGVFISYLIEVVVIFVVYIFLRLLDQRRRPERYFHMQPIANKVIGIIPLVLVQYFIIGWMSAFIDDSQNFIKQNLLLSDEVVLITISTVFFYTVKAIRTSKHDDRIDLFQNTFIFNVLAITAANVFGSILVMGAGVTSLLIVLIVMTGIRLWLEWLIVKKLT